MREFLDLAWMKPDKELRAPNLMRMTRWSNHIVHWIVSEIVSVKDNLKARAAAFERIIMLGQALEKLNNFNGVKEVLAALQSSSVYRLKKMKEAVGSKYHRIYDDLMKLTSSELNYKNLRAKVHSAQPPLIPFPGVYQGDLVFLDTCSKNQLEGGLVNFQKLYKTSTYLLELQNCQETPYALEPVVEIQDYVRNYSTLDDDQAYNQSLACEPRN
ncbi:ras guanine nucleotide exchange factor domain-containing protein [Blyttiomyces helicus]|uniref:Ras guanine nucleotide exchange factor domain-containing protein n=1 Tax=Blyttiomyces helicus TaxID=388810 RepID=A0A4P9WDW1_9FUNG|nr:ras guanine nucleotide exchange factor domain-containing protein [Blyttiomyces helicus]|eukprot:RKO89150.1 ras guanine nucleotide exchange factor domain-containing protein [Blyttiomyces helicus]